MGLRARAQRLHRRRHRGHRRPDRAVRPGFRDRVIGQTVSTTTQFAAHNPNFVGGDIMTGAKDLRQLVFGPRITLSPYHIGVPGMYIGSAAPSPGPGAHGMCGTNGGQAALRDMRTRGLVS